MYCSCTLNDDVRQTVAADGRSVKLTASWLLLSLPWFVAV